MLILLLLGGYLSGSVHPAFLAGALRGIDLRQYGGGTVSATGAYHHVARWAFLPVALLDVLKAAVPAWLGLQLAGPLGAAAAGLAAVVGHNWSAFLGLRGGRGLSPYLGLLLVVFPPGALWLAGWVILGRLLGQTPAASLLALLGIPLLARLADQPPAVLWASLAMLALTVLKRLEANRLPLPADPLERRRVLWRRLWLDRDVPRGEPWVERRPPPARAGVED